MLETLINNWRKKGQGGGGNRDGRVFKKILNKQKTYMITKMIPISVQELLKQPVVRTMSVALDVLNISETITCIFL